MKNNIAIATYLYISRVNIGVPIDLGVLHFDECEAFRHNLCIIIIKFCTMCIIYVIRHYFQRIFLFIVF